MSVLNQSGEEQVECPLCMEPLEVDDLHFYPCTCGYQICRFCWNRIREGENGRCPACRKAYPENPADFTPLSQEQVAAIKIEKRAREQKRRNKTLESRRALANVRVVQKNLVFVVGLPVRLADPEILKRQEYFGKYGKIHKVVINQSTTYAGSQGPSASAYVTYMSSADALRAIQGVNNVALDGRVLKGSLGTTKYCANFMKNQPCPKPDCMYLHELGDPDASFTKEEMHAGLHQAYERRLHEQLLAITQREQAREAEKASAPPPGTTGATSSSGTSNFSTNSEKSSSKDGNQSKFIPTTIITSSHINNIINSTSKSKKESSASNSNGSNMGSSNSSISNSSSNVVGGKEAWPSLGSSPPADMPQRKLPSPSQNSIKSQENGTSNGIHTQQQLAQTKNNKDSYTDKTSSSRHNKDNGTNHNNHRKNKSDSKYRQKHSNGINENEINEGRQISDAVQQNSVFETDLQSSYLSNELNELESERHSLLETHDLLDNSDHSLLEDDNNHSLLDDANSDVLMMQRNREMLAGLVDNNHIINQMKPVNGYILDNNMYLGNERQLSQMYPNIEKELAQRERNREMMMRQNELMARQNVLLDKHYMPQSSIGMESANDLLGANYHNNAGMLASFGMRVGNASGAMGVASGGTPYSLQPRLLPQPPLMNGYDATSLQQSEGRYLAENMDKFFTDFHKTQQMRLLLTRGGVGGASGGMVGSGMGGVTASPSQHDARLDRPRNMLSAERLEMDHKQRIGYGGNTRCGEAGGDADDDLDFDPFKETQKALAEMIESEMMHNNTGAGVVSGGDNNAHRSRLPPPGFTHMNAFGVGLPRAAAASHPHTAHHQGFNTQNMYTDWTVLDPAIMSTSVSFPKTVSTANVHPLAPPHGALSQQQQEMFARFNQLNVSGVSPANGMVKPTSGQAIGPWGSKLGWAVPAYTGIPLPPGFAPPKTSQRPTECVDAN